MDLKGDSLETETIELAADGIGINPDWDIYASFDGPPFEVRFEVERGETWPAVTLRVGVGRQIVVSFDTTEPRLKQALQAILAEIS